MAKSIWILGRRAKVLNAAIANLTLAVGTANDTVQDVGATHDQTILNNNFQDIVTKLNAVLVVLRDAKLIVT